MDDKTRRRLLAFIEANPGARRADFAGLMDDLGRKDSSTLWRWLSELKQEGIIVSDGALKGTRYYVKVPANHQRVVDVAVADIVRFGHTIALDRISKEQGRDRMCGIVQRELTQLTPADLPRYGLNEDEFNRYRQSQSPVAELFADEFDLSFAHGAHHTEQSSTLSEAPSFRG